MRSSLLFALACVALLAITLVPLPASAQESADGSLEQQIYAALIDADFDPDNIGPETRRAIRAWQWDKGYEQTGTLTGEQLRLIRTKAPSPATVVPKCAELPGQYLENNQAECWEEVENQPGCFVWLTHYQSDQTIRWTGSCRRGVAEGYGTYSVYSVSSEHAVYERTGMLANGKATGRWVERWSGGVRAEREYRDGMPNGYGTMDYASGARYEGEWRDGGRHGYGTMDYASGARYEGEWRDGGRHGYGLHDYANGSEFDGEFRDDNPFLGTYTYSSGVIYDGKWRDGESHGFGTQTWPSGSHYVGQWRDGRPHGYGTYTNSDGDHYTGSWRAGCFEDRSARVALASTFAECGFE